MQSLIVEHEIQSKEQLNNIVFGDDTLINLSLYDKELNGATNIKIALITDNNDLRKLNYYLLKEVSDIDYYTIDDLNPDNLDMIDDMDIIIYNKEEQELKEEILHRIKAKKLKTKFFMISNKPYLRQKDILTEHINGVDKLMKMDFFLEDYILSMEKYLHSNFYSKRLLALEDSPEVVLHDKKVFYKRVDDLIEKKIFFSIFRYKYQSEIDIDDYNIKKIVREHDNILIDKQKNEILFLLLNVVPEFGAQLIKKRIDNFSIYLTPVESLNAFDLVFDHPEEEV
jgi:hypothetical protein